MPYVGTGPVVTSQKSSASSRTNGTASHSHHKYVVGNRLAANQGTEQYRREWSLRTSPTHVIGVQFYSLYYTQKNTTTGLVPVKVV
jgi:hypothetical protein